MFCFKWTHLCNLFHVHRPQDLFRNSVPEKIIFSPNRPANLPVISKKEFWILCVLNIFFSLNRLYIYFICRPYYILYCIILELLILIFAISRKVLFKLFSDSIDFSVASFMDIFFPQSISAVSCDIKYLNCGRVRRPHLPDARPAVTKFPAMAYSSA